MEKSILTMIIISVEGVLLFSFEFSFRMIPGIPFRQAVVSSDGTYIIVVTVDKTMKDCIAIYNATTGNYLHKVPFKGCNIKVFHPTVIHSKN